MKNAIKILAVVFLISGCATAQWVNQKPEWNPELGCDWAIAQCKAKADTVGDAYDYYEKNQAYFSCMRAYGYVYKKVN